MKKYDKLTDYIIATKCFWSEDVGTSVKLKNVLLISDISLAIGKLNIYKVIGDKENISYMEKIIENRLDDDCIYLDDYEEWYKDNKEFKITEDAE